MDVVSELLKWGKQRPEWQQTALQWIYEKGALSEGDIASLAALAKKEQGFSVTGAIASPLTLAGDTVVQEPTPTVLLGVEAVVNSNALSPDASLAFAKSGLTLIFGDNGTGKSGYVRILKQVCRARGDRDTVYPHAYKESEEPTQATVRYMLGDSAPLEYVWTPGASGPIALHRASILDGKAAFVYVDGQQDVAYLPLGLDLFPRLAKVCGQVSEALEREIDTEARERDRFPEIPEATSVGQVLQLIEQTATRKKLEGLRVVSEEARRGADLMRAEVAAATAGQSEERAIEFDLRAQRVKSVADAIGRDMKLIDPSTEQEYHEKRVHSAELMADAAKAAEKTSEGFPLRGLGDESWAELWKAARKFAEHGALPKQPFPPAEGGLCVLCQQPVDSAAAARLAAFDVFVSEALVTSARDAESALTSFLERFRGGESSTELEGPIVEELNNELETLGVRAALVRTQLNHRRAALLAKATEIPIYPPDGEALLVDLRTIIEKAKERATALRATQDTEVLRARKADLAGLDARIKLDQLWPRVESELGRWDRIRRLRVAEASTTTTGITKKAKELFDEAVTTPLADQFHENVEALGLGHIPIAFAPAKGKKGMALHQVQLEGRLDVNNGDVLSEGEARAVAIAGFLAEVHLQEDSSTLVFDDPVSSLDLGRREFVARALVALAKRRPVVVFTHDMPFAWQLHESAKEHGVTVQERQLRRTRVHAGVVSQAISGSGLGARKRIGPLKQRAVNLKKIWEGDIERYDREARVLYGELREVWERGVEDVLLQGAVRRFGREIKTQSLSKLHLLRLEDMQRLEAGMTKCSGLLFGHDQPDGLGRPIPDAAELEADVAECEAWLTDLTKLYAS